MKNNIQLAITTIGIVVLVLVGVGGIIWFVFPRLDSTAITALVGIMIGSIFTIAGSAINSILGTWVKNREFNERMRDRVSDGALQLTKMDYELRQKSLELVKEKRLFLAPIKVYRELYRALLELNEKGTWPRNIQELGLLNIFPLGVEASQAESEDTKENTTDTFETSFVPEDSD